MAQKKYKTKSQEQINEELDKLLDNSLEQIKKYSKDPKEMLEYAKFISKIHNYSTTNLALIDEQFNGARAVASFQNWSKQGFRINKGEKGIEIYAFTPYTKFVDKNGYEKYLKNATPLEKQQIKNKELNSWQVDSFKKGHVYDISQTNATENDLPKIFPNKVWDFNIKDDHDIENLEKGINAIANSIGIEIKDMQDGKIGELGAARGAFVKYVDGSEEIILNSRNTRTQNLAVSIHELAHAKLHSEIDDNKSIPVKELQAELTSYIVSYHFGMDTSEKAIPYIARWTKNGERIEPKEMRGILEEVKKTAVSFIEEIDKEIIQERDLIQEEVLVSSINKDEVETVGVSESLNIETKEEQLLTEIKGLTIEEQKLFVQIGRASVEELNNHEAYIAVQGDMKFYQDSSSEVETVALKEMSNQFSEVDLKKINKLYQESIFDGAEDEAEPTDKIHVYNLKETLKEIEKSLEPLTFDNKEDKFLYEFKNLSLEEQKLFLQIGKMSKESLDNFYADYSSHDESKALDKMKKEFSNEEYAKVSKVYGENVFDSTGYAPEDKVHVDSIERIVSDDQVKMNEERLSKTFNDLSPDKQDLFIKMSRAGSETLINSSSKYSDFTKNQELNEFKVKYPKKEIDSVSKIYEEQVYNGMGRDTGDKVHVDKVEGILDRKEFVSNEARLAEKLKNLTPGQQKLFLQLNKSSKERIENYKKYPSNFILHNKSEEKAYDNLKNDSSEVDVGKVEELFYASVRFNSQPMRDTDVSISDVEAILENIVNENKEMTLKNTFEAENVFEEDSSKLNEEFFKKYENSETEINNVELEGYQASVEAVPDNRIVMNGVTVDLPYYAANTEARTMLGVGNYYRDMITYYEDQSELDYGENINESDQTSEYNIGQNKLILDHACNEIVYLDKYGVTENKAKNDYSYEVLNGRTEDERKYIEAFLQKSTIEFEAEQKQLISQSSAITNSFSSEDFNIPKTESMYDVVIRESSYNLSDKAEIYYDKNKWSSEMERQTNENIDSFDNFQTLDDPKEFYEMHKEEIEETINFLSSEHGIDRDLLISNDKENGYEEAASIFTYQVALTEAQNSLADFEIPEHPRLKRVEIVEPIVNQRSEMEMA